MASTVRPRAGLAETDKPSAPSGTFPPTVWLNAKDRSKNVLIQECLAWYEYEYHLVRVACGAQKSALVELASRLVDLAPHGPTPSTSSPQQRSERDSYCKSAPTICVAVLFPSVLLGSLNSPGPAQSTSHQPHAAMPGKSLLL